MSEALESPDFPAPEPPAAVPPRVLCVDDDIMILSGLQRQLRKEFEVVGALGGEKALKALEERGPFAVVISDLQMPGMNGLEFLARARSVAPHTVRLILSGRADLDTAIRAVNEGTVFRFLTKPCPPETLAPSVHSAAEHYRLTLEKNDLLSRSINESVRAELTNLETQAEEGRRIPGDASLHPGELSDFPELANLDPSSGLPDFGQAQGALAALLPEADSIVIAVFCIHRIGFTLSRYGKAVCTKVLWVSGQHLITALEPYNATLFRWRGPAFIAIMPSEKTPTALKNDLQVSTALVRDQYIEGPWRTIYLPIRMSVDVLAVQNISLDQLTTSIDEFVRRHSDEVGIPV